MLDVRIASFGGCLCKKKNNLCVTFKFSLLKQFLHVSKRTIVISSNEMMLTAGSDLISKSWQNGLFSGSLQILVSPGCVATVIPHPKFAQLAPLCVGGVHWCTEMMFVAGRNLISKS